MDTRKSVSVAIVNFNGRDTLQATIESVMAQDYPGMQEILLADNRSTDDSVDVVRGRFPAVRLLQTAGNRGPNIARNLGLNSARTDLVLIMDNDIVLAPDYVSRTVRAFERFPATGAVSGQIRLQEAPDVVQYQGGVDIHYAGAAVQIRRDEREFVPAGAVSAGAVLVDRTRALAVGGFDEDFIFGWEDGDFAFRLALAGYPNCVAPGAVCYHMKQKRGLKWVRYQVRNRWWFVLKNYDARTILLAMPAILFYQCSVGGVCLIRGKFLDFLRGSADAIVTIPAVLRKRKAVQRLKRVPDSRTLCGRAIDTLGDAGSSRLVRTGNAISNRLLSGYWRLIRRFVR